MAKKIGIVISVLLFIAGAIGMYLSFGSVEFSSPNEGGVFSKNVLPYILLIVSAMTGFALLWNLMGYKGFEAPFTLANILVLATVVSTLFLSGWAEDKDLEKNGIKIQTTVDSTRFEWVKTSRGGEWLYYALLTS